MAYIHKCDQALVELLLLLALEVAKPFSVLVLLS